MIFLEKQNKTKQTQPLLSSSFSATNFHKQLIPEQRPEIKSTYSLCNWPNVPFTAQSLLRTTSCWGLFASEVFHTEK